MASRVALLLCCFCWLSRTTALKSTSGQPEGFGDWTKIKAGGINFADPFSVEALIAAKDKVKDCTWPKGLRYSKTKEERVSSVPMDGTDSEQVTKMLFYNGAGSREEMRLTRAQSREMIENFDCTFSDLQGTADRFVVSLRNPAHRFLSGIDAMLKFEMREWLTPEENSARYAFKRALGEKGKMNAGITGFEFLEALQYNDTELSAAYGLKDMHKKAMALTHCHHCMDFMLPVVGYYFRDDKAAMNSPNVKYLCDCEHTVNQKMQEWCTEWDTCDQTRLIDKQNWNSEWKRIAIMKEVRSYLHKLYAADHELYRKKCGYCMNQPIKWWNGGFTG